MLFTILTFVEPLEAVAAEPSLAAKLMARIDELPEPVLAYKNLQRHRPAIAADFAGA